MIKAGRKKIITIETLQRTVILQSSNQIQKFWCEFCQAEVEMIIPERGANSLGITVREIYRRIERGELHFIETETGEVFICLDQFMKKQRGVEK